MPVHCASLSINVGYLDSSTGKVLEMPLHLKTVKKDHLYNIDSSRYSPTALTPRCFGEHCFTAPLLDGQNLSRALFSLTVVALKIDATRMDELSLFHSLSL